MPYLLSGVDSKVPQMKEIDFGQLFQDTPTLPSFGIEAISQEKVAIEGQTTENTESEDFLSEDDSNDVDEDTKEPDHKPPTVTQYKSKEVLFMPETAPIPSAKVQAAESTDDTAPLIENQPNEGDHKSETKLD